MNTENEYHIELIIYFKYRNTIGKLSTIEKKQIEEIELLYENTESRLNYLKAGLLAYKKGDITEESEICYEMIKILTNLKNKKIIEKHKNIHSSSYKEIKDIKILNKLNKFKEEEIIHRKRLSEYHKKRKMLKDKLSFQSNLKYFLIGLCLVIIFLILDYKFIMDLVVVLKSVPPVLGFADLLKCLFVFINLKISISCLLYLCEYIKPYYIKKTYYFIKENKTFCFINKKDKFKLMKEEELKDELEIIKYKRYKKTLDIIEFLQKNDLSKDEKETLEKFIFINSFNLNREDKYEMI